MLPLDGAPSPSFIRALRAALRYLYVPAQLRQNPLLQLFGLDPREGPAALRALILDAIETLRPPAATPPRARPWRAYQSLLFLYVQQFSQAEVATTLALSTRQLRRHEGAAVQALAEHLWAQHGFAEGPPPLRSPTGQGPRGESEQPSREQELAWLGKSFPTGPADIAGLLASAARTVAPLARAQAVTLDCALPPQLPRVAVQAASVRQALLDLLAAAVRSAPGGQVSVQAESREQQVTIRILAQQPAQAHGAPPADRSESLEMARRLAALSGASLDTGPGEAVDGAFDVRLKLAAADEMSVLVIDDNVDTLQLFQRYLAGTRYAFVGARDPQQALDLAASLPPRIIVLDVMLPGVDGWELLGHLREHPRLRDVPIIVCSILPEEALALALGAAAFLRKPVSRLDFLAALDLQAPARAPAGG